MAGLLIHGKVTKIHLTSKHGGDSESKFQGNIAMYLRQSRNSTSFIIGALTMHRGMIILSYHLGKLISLCRKFCVVQQSSKNGLYRWTNVSVQGLIHATVKRFLLALTSETS